MKWILHLSRRLGLLIATAIASAVFLLDVSTSAELRLFPLYFVAIILAASVASRPQTYAFAAYCTLVWFVSKHLDGTAYSTTFTWVWNTLAQGGSFTLVALLVQRLAATVAAEQSFSLELADRNERLHQQQASLERLNQELGDALHAVEDADRIARHDLRTPLGGIIATLGMLMSRPGLDGDEQRLLAIARRSARRALAMVNLSLSLHKMERGEFTFQPESVDLQATVQAVIDDLREHADAKALHIGFDAVAAIPAAEGQSDLAYSLVANILKNAIEAAPEGSALEIRLGAQEATVSLSVANAGAVPADIRGRFFSKYATSGKAGGSGLGAYSARLIARALGGDLTMETSDAGGTTLELSLRRATSAAPAGPVSHVRIGHPLAVDACPEILIVDDDEYNRLILARLLPPGCRRVTTAVNGKLALECIRDWRPNLIFMDIHMPVMGGIEALHAIRAFQAAAGQVPSVVVAFSAIDDARSQDTYLAEGFDACLGKPCTRQDVMALLAGRQGAQTGTADERNDTVWVEADLLPMLPEFRASREALLADLVDALLRGERGEGRRLAHQLGGSLGIFGFHAASAACKALEAELETGDTAALAERARHILDHLRTATVRPRRQEPGTDATFADAQGVELPHGRNS
ncbi:MAG: response regulator [Betaproteobacteria bacterium]|nr:response regulator [Betaproteobacteria bacterium]